MISDYIEIMIMRPFWTLIVHLLGRRNGQHLLLQLLFTLKITFLAYLPLLVKNSIDHDYYLASRCDVNYGFPLITIIRWSRLLDTLEYVHTCTMAPKGRQNWINFLSRFVSTLSSFLKGHWNKLCPCFGDICEEAFFLG